MEAEANKIPVPEAPPGRLRRILPEENTVRVRNVIKNYEPINIDSNFIINLVKLNKKIIGVGETGLDFFYTHSEKNIQKNSFVEHIDAAIELKIPIIVHSRDAEKETYEILKYKKKNSDLKVLIHCFTGSQAFAKN